MLTLAGCGAGKMSLLTWLAAWKRTEIGSATGERQVQSDYNDSRKVPWPRRTVRCQWSIDAVITDRLQNFQQKAESRTLTGCPEISNLHEIQDALRGSSRTHLP